MEHAHFILGYVWLGAGRPKCRRDIRKTIIYMAVTSNTGEVGMASQ